MAQYYYLYSVWILTENPVVLTQKLLICDSLFRWFRMRKGSFKTFKWLDFKQVRQDFTNILYHESATNVKPPASYCVGSTCATRTALGCYSMDMGPLVLFWDVWH